MLENTTIIYVIFLFCFLRNQKLEDVSLIMYIKVKMYICDNEAGEVTKE